MKTRKTFITRGSKEEKTIYVQLFIKQERVSFTTGVKVMECNYDDVSGKVLSKDKGWKEKNLILERIKAKINDVEVKCKLQDRILTKEIFLREYKRVSGAIEVVKFANEFLNKNKLTIEHGTLKSQKTHIKNFESYKKDVVFEEVDYDFLNGYMGWLKRKMKFSEAYAYKNMATLKKIMRAAKRQGVTEMEPFKDWKIKTCKSKEIVYLTEAELMKLRDAYIYNVYGGTEKRVLQFFLWMCFGSQHVSDAKATRVEDVSGDTLHYFRIKNRNSKPEKISIPMNAALRQIYDEVRDGRDEGVLFESMISDQKINQIIKKIVQKEKIDKNVSCKTGRHTFATYFLQKTQQLVALKEMLGHSDIKETLIYAHVIDESKREGVSCFDVFI